MRKTRSHRRIMGIEFIDDKKFIKMRIPFAYENGLSYFIYRYDKDPTNRREELSDFFESVRETIFNHINHDWNEHWLINQYPPS